MSELFDETYFMDGKRAGVSLYENYTWKADLTIPMVRAIVRHLGVEHGDSILDFGCARGYVVRAFREMGWRACGVDASNWAVENCDESVRKWVNWINPQYVLSHDIPVNEFDWVLAKDVLEHIPMVADKVQELMGVARRGVFAVVPLSACDGGPYVVADYERDVTHLHRFTLATWVRMFLQPGWSVEASYRVRGVKDNYYKPEWEKANGFITARRVEG